MKTKLVLIGIWVTALASSAALAYTLTRAPRPVGTLDDVLGVPQAGAAKVAPAPREALGDVVELPPLHIVGYVRRALPRHRTGFRDLADMRCSNWRELLSGPITQRVRYCE